MSSLAPPPPSKRRKVSKAENSVCNKKELKRPFCKLDDGKVLEAARGGSQDVNVTFYSANEVTLPYKKARKNEKVWSDLKQGPTGMLQNCRSSIKKDKEDMAKAGCASHHDHLKHRRKHSSKHCSSFKTINLRDLLPRSKFHSVRKRTPCKVEHKRTGASLYSPDGLVSESKWGAAANWRNNFAVPISVGAALGTSPLVSQNLGRAATESELIPVCGVKRKGSTLDGGGLEGKRKITKAYVRNKNREPFFKDTMPDHYALHLLADTALNLGPEPIFHDNVQKQEGESRQGHNEHEPLSTNSKSHASKVNAERSVGEASTSEAASVFPKDLQSDKVLLNAHVLPEANHLICTSIDEKQNFNQELMKKDEELISNNNITINSLMAGFHVAKESHEVATNVDQKAHGVENESIGCHSSMLTQPSTLEGFQTGRSNVKDLTKLSSAPSIKILQDAFTPEHGKRIDETTVKKDDIDLKRDSEIFREPHPVFVSVESVCHDKASSSCCELEPCSTFHENSQPRLLTCMETPQKSDGYPSSSNTKSHFDRSVEESLNYKGCSSSFNSGKSSDQSPGYRVREIVRSSKLEATRMVDAAIKVMSSTKVGEDAYAMIGEALNPAGIQLVGAHSRISRLQSCSYPQNGGPGNCLQDLSCNPAVVASIAHSINSTVPAFTWNDSQSSPKMISACVAALLMIQACSDTGVPPAEAMEILEHAAKDLQPQFPQNLHIYREIEELMGIIKTQILSLVRTPGLNLQM
ncbi:hypothetical protein M5K25_024431 [Dendrobium thyrsiflorum]|uniref:Uncharacterized protein n=1 Tax=Dendrobium thyrsiflorum TaxID=117978 RepID=A0ABD0U2D0_DENTH